MITTEKNVFVKITQLKPEYLVMKKYCKKKVILTYMVMHEGDRVSRQACRKLLYSVIYWNSAQRKVK